MIKGILKTLFIVITMPIAYIHGFGLIFFEENYTRAMIETIIYLGFISWLLSPEEDEHDQS